ncbi:iron chelate uptake ABC transporter family permease subunit [Amycolatopsis rubida]|uniref:Iron chelate uptake ABC transporter family permease subunit n=1 Tax=Amycolatopsis rubida TaxID=112413 RepID=A0A1I5S3P5_9PSEU|nr:MULTISPECIES: iron chelate uptake ABC transporter family permease subunit [Amycolatopsis]MYW89601.1 iron chelate uptake ABC transporter family permease subunit [Amycolatopsis rubida]NEC54578.1 iron chelate uptake ABC transporter family permease subunit [Amycolatopsis rubida]OAP20638.1 Ferric enterobactin transport system permease protein FepD [Amycolatopsis sp. M39]SFP65388.1 iron complex transport system permease protein [Amycolatopsis rubida]
MTAVSPAPPGADRRRLTTLRIAGLVVILALVLAAMLVSVAVGAKHLPLGVVWDAVFHFDGSYDANLVWDQRIPRTLLGALVGAALGGAGALMQAVTRNPLADPVLFGVEAGASVAVVTAISFLGVSSLSGYVWFALAGAAATSVLVYVLGASSRGGATPVRLALAGTVVTAVLTGVITAFTTMHAKTWQVMRFWTIGSLVNRGYDVLWEVLPFIAAGVVLGLAVTGALNALALGDDAGRALGAHAGRTRIVSMLAIVLLCGGATAAAGPIGFVGLAVPHAVRAIAGPDNRWVVPYSMAVAPLLVVGADVVGRVVLPTGELEAGVVTAVIGAPVFIHLVRRKRLAKL